MPPEPLSDEQLIRQFVAPVGVLLTERAAVLATVYAGVMASDTGSHRDRFDYAKSAVIDFLRMMDQ